jgi:hypothetical protein
VRIKKKIFFFDVNDDTAVDKIWCSVSIIYVSSDARIKQKLVKKKILDVNGDTASDNIYILNIQPKAYEYCVCV